MAIFSFEADDYSINSLESLNKCKNILLEQNNTLFNNAKRFANGALLESLFNNILIISIYIFFLLILYKSLVVIIDQVGYEFYLEHKILVVFIFNNILLFSLFYFLVYVLFNFILCLNVKDFVIKIGSLVCLFYYYKNKTT